MIYCVRAFSNYCNLRGIIYVLVVVNHRTPALHWQW
uniref:Uncharacterized protein n=1 Tax=Anguilla anguilla TaxID=7936 RepID=A0A0E9ULH5_ANGAN